jgi:nucleoside-diphosphate-sugar epimerase
MPCNNIPLRERQQLSIFEDPVGSGIWKIRTTATGTFNLHTENVTVLELAQRIKGIVTDAEIEQTEISFQDARNYRVSSDSARSTLGFAPKWTIEDGIRQVADAIWNKRIKDVGNPRFNNSESLRLQWGVRK